MSDKISVQEYKKLTSQHAPPKEEVFEKVMITHLRSSGYIVWKTGDKRRSEPLVRAVGQFMIKIGKPLSPEHIITLRKVINATLRGKGENTVGLPDLIISHEDWPKHSLLGIELKGERTEVSLEQTAYCQLGIYPICKTSQQVIDVIMVKEKEFKTDLELLRIVRLQANSNLGF